MAFRARRLGRVVVSFVVVAALVVLARPYVSAMSFIIRATSLGGVAERAADAIANGVSVEPIGSIPTRYGSVRSRFYRPSRGVSRVALLVPGIHAAGIDEVRLTGLAYEVAATGVGVITMALPDLTEYRITPQATDVIEDGVTFLSRQRQYAPDGTIGIVGISFAGGLAIVAAGRDSVRDRVAYVLSLGGHGDLPRVLRFLCTGIQPTGPGLPQNADGTGLHRQPHDYGVAVILYGVADLMVPPAQVPPLRAAVRTFLLASQETLVDMRRAEAMFQQARDLEAPLPEPARTYLHWVNTRDVGQLGPALLPHLAALGGDAALSPDRAPRPPAAPVYLLHGADDSVIPAIESQLLGRYLEQKGADAHVLLSGLITHAEVDRSAATSDVLKLIGFWASLLRR